MNYLKLTFHSALKLLGRVSRFIFCLYVGWNCTVKSLLDKTMGTLECKALKDFLMKIFVDFLFQFPCCQAFCLSVLFFHIFRVLDAELTLYWYAAKSLFKALRL